MELAAEENTVFALLPIIRIVPTTITRMTASMTAYSAISCPWSSDQRRRRRGRTILSPTFGNYEPASLLMVGGHLAQMTKVIAPPVTLPKSLAWLGLPWPGLTDDVRGIERFTSTERRAASAAPQFQRRFSASNSSSVRGQSDPSRRDRLRSASTLPP